MMATIQSNIGWLVGWLVGCRCRRASVCCSPSPAHTRATTPTLSTPLYSRLLSLYLLARSRSHEHYQWLSLSLSGSHTHDERGRHG